METFSAQWFVLYYTVLGILLLLGGGFLLFSYQAVREYLQQQADSEQPPGLPRKILKYLFLFTLPCLILSFFPFSWIELLFSIWSLVMVFIGGSLLLRWPQIRYLVDKHYARTDFYIRMTGAIMMAVSLIIFVLSYRMITILSL